MATIGDINLEEPSTVTKRLAAVEITRNSTVQSQEVMVLGSPNSTTSLALAEVTGSAPPSTTVGLVVRIASGPSTATDLAVRALLPSTAADNPVQIGAVAASTLVQNSTRYVSVRITDGTNFATPAIDYTHDSTMTASTVTGPGVLLRGSATAPSAIGGDDRFVLQWALRNGAAVSALTDANGAIVNTSTSAPSSNAVGIITRPVVSGIQTYSASTTGQSTATTIASSAAGSKAYVFSYSITSTASTGAVGIGFYDGATRKWGLKLSSGFAGANLAVSPPAYLFSGSTGEPLTFNTESTVTGGMHVSIGYWVST
jgi:hypothetical protein